MAIPSIERKPTLKSYKQIRAELDRLQREANAARKAESAGVIAKLKKTIEEYGLTAADLGLDTAEAVDAADKPARKAASKSASRKAPGKKAAVKKPGRASAGVAKYHDPASGKSWSGFGRVPGWLASTKDREVFRVGANASPQPKPETQAAAQPEPEAATPPVPPASKKAAKKAGAKAAGKKSSAKKAPAKKAAGKKAAAKKTASAEGGAADSGAGGEAAADQPTALAAGETAPSA